MFQIKMLPSEPPYTGEELERLYCALSEAAEANVTEQDEVDGVVALLPRRSQEAFRPEQPDAGTAECPICLGGAPGDPCDCLHDEE